MKKPQTRWAIVLESGHIEHYWMAFTRRAAIDKVLKEYRGYTSPKHNGEGLTDSQFWRQIKQQRGFTVRRVSMEVVS